MTTEPVSLTPPELFLVSLGALCLLYLLAVGYASYIQQGNAGDDDAARPEPPEVNHYEGSVPDES